MNIVYGGSFNPPTIAHLEIIHHIWKDYKPDHLIIMPVGTNYERKTILASNEDRINMLKILTKNLPNIIISDEEMKGDYKGTYHTLKKLSVKYDDLVFVLGADNLLELDTWINPDGLLEEFSFLVFTRDDIDVKKIIDEKYAKYKNHFMISNLHLHVSSSMIRENFEDKKNLLTNEVYDYIKENNLYRKD